MNDFTDAPSIKPDHSTLNVTWTVLIQIRLNCVFFEGCIPPPPTPFVLWPAFKYKALIAGIYLPPFEYFTKAGLSWQPWSEKTLPTCFVLSARTTKFLFFVLSFMAHANLQRFLRTWSPKRLETELTKYGKTALFFITLFLYWTFPFIYFIFFLLSEFCFRYLFVLTYFDSSRRHTRQGRK